MNSLADKSVYIIGPMQLQNALMATFLRESIGTSCFVVKSFSDIHEGEEEQVGGDNLLLWDCLGRNPLDCLLEMKANGDGVSKRNLLSLFNVPHDSNIEEEAVDWGVRGFFYEGDPLEQLSKGVRAMLHGELWLSRRVMSECLLKKHYRDLSVSGGETVLTGREIEILAMVRAGSTNELIASQLCISHHTVKTHIYNIFKKIHVSNRLQAALWASRNL
jgi:LuxR family transcriptional regulator, positive regulator of biofilm formation